MDLNCYGLTLQYCESNGAHAVVIQVVTWGTLGGGKTEDLPTENCLYQCTKIDKLTLAMLHWEIKIGPTCGQ